MVFLLFKYDYSKLWNKLLYCLEVLIIYGWLTDQLACRRGRQYSEYTPPPPPTPLIIFHLPLHNQLSQLQDIHKQFVLMGTVGSHVLLGADFSWHCNKFIRTLWLSYLVLACFSWSHSLSLIPKIYPALWNRTIIPNINSFNFMFIKWWLSGGMDFSEP